MKNNDFTSGAILPKLLKFMLPVLFSMFLQALYGAVDLLVVGQFASTADVAAVSTGSQIITTITNLIVSFSMGIIPFLWSDYLRGTFCLSLGVTQVPVARQTRMGSASTSAAESLMSGRETMTFQASNFILREVLPTLVISPTASM